MARKTLRKCQRNIALLHMEVVGKNQDFMLIRLLNAGIWLDVVGTLNQSESCTEVHRGAWRCAEGYTEVHDSGGEKNQDFYLN